VSGEEAGYLDDEALGPAADEGYEEEEVGKVLCWECEETEE
jgi:hypothetical protein